MRLIDVDALKADSWADKYKFCPDCGARMDGHVADSFCSEGEKDGDNG